METSNSKYTSKTSDKVQNTNGQTGFDLEDRMAKFGEGIILLCKSVKQDSITRPLINQIVRSATSIGANYCEANNGSSRKDFRNKAYIAKKEAQETKHWLRMLKAASPDRAVELRVFWKESHEFVLILQSIINKVGGR